MHLITKTLLYRLALHAALLLCVAIAAFYALYPHKAIATDRVAAARNNKDTQLQKLFAQKKVAYPPKRMYIRIFKSENVLEVWAANNNDTAYTHIKTYPICAMSGKLGPKRKEGDEQVPEGFYQIGTMNPYSAYHLSMLVTYPNASDRKLSPHSRLGGDIYIHGNCKSIGCIAITDPQIEELYWLTQQVRSRSQNKIPVHIFPSRLSDMKYNILCFLYSDQPKLLQFWNGLKQGYDWFEHHKKPPTMEVTAQGYYQLTPNQNITP